MSTIGVAQCELRVTLGDNIIARYTWSADQVFQTQFQGNLIFDASDGTDQLAILRAINIAPIVIFVDREKFYK